RDQAPSGTSRAAAAASEMAPAGQAPTQAPQPVQRSASTRGRGTACVGGKRMAASPQASRQLMHTMPRTARQPSPTVARSDHGASWTGAKAPAGQAAAQSPQKVHSPRAGTNSGSPPSARASTA